MTMNTLTVTDDLIIMNWQEAPCSGALNTQTQAILTGMQQTLARYGVPFGHMLKHTIAIRDQQVDPIEAITTFHQICHQLAPALKTHPSVGTIFRLPHFVQPDTLIAVEAVFARKTSAIRRVPFLDMPMDVARALDYQGHQFLTGFEALEILPSPPETPLRWQVRESLNTQTEVVLNKIITSLQSLRTPLKNIRQLTLYLREDQDPQLVREGVTQFLAQYGVAGVHFFILRGHGMVLDSFKLEIDGLAYDETLALRRFLTLSVGEQGQLSQALMETAATTLVKSLSNEPPTTHSGLHIVLKSACPVVPAEQLTHWKNHFTTTLQAQLAERGTYRLSVSFLYVQALLDEQSDLELDVTLLP